MKVLLPPDTPIEIRKDLNHPWSESRSTRWTECEVVHKYANETYMVVRLNGWYAKVLKSRLRFIPDQSSRLRKNIVGPRKPKPKPFCASRTPNVRVGMRDYKPPIAWRQNEK